MQDIYLKEDKLDLLRQEDDQLLAEFKELKEDNEQRLKDLEQEMARLAKRELAVDKWMKDQEEDITRRIEYVGLKNRRVEEAKGAEEEKLGRERERWAGRVRELEEQLEEADRERRLAGVLHKTYLDEMEREGRRQAEGGEEKGEKEAVEQEVIIRNNEGKMCKKKRVTRKRRRCDKGSTVGKTAKN